MKKKPNPMRVEDLARITSEEFSELRKLNYHIVQVLDSMQRSLDGMQTDLRYVKQSTRNFPLLEREVENLAHRVTRLERRAGTSR